MIVVIYTVLICDDNYRFEIARFEILEYATLSVGYGKSLTEVEMDKMWDCRLTQSQVGLK